MQNDDLLLCHGKQWNETGEIVVNPGTELGEHQFRLRFPACNQEMPANGIPTIDNLFNLLFPVQYLTQIRTFTNGLCGENAELITISDIKCYLGLRLFMAIDPIHTNVKDYWSVKKLKNSCSEPKRYGIRFGMPSNRFQFISQKFALCQNPDVVDEVAKCMSICTIMFYRTILGVLSEAL
jgi:hypothetical protein